MNKNSVISANNLTIGYPKTRKRDRSVLHSHLSFDLFAGELTCLLGSNGIGKSTLLRTLTALHAPIDGEVYLEKRKLSGLKETELATKLGLVLTDRNSIGGLTVSELVALGRYPYTGFFGRLSKKDNKIVEKAMDDVCIIHKAQAYIAELSDGERQKAMIAKVLAQECPIIILDEPTAFLDIVSRIEIMNLLHHLAHIQHKAILLSTHDIEQALLLSDRLWLLSEERGLESGTTEDLVLNNKMDIFFSNNSIVFDKSAGNFSLAKTHDKKVFLQSKNSILKHWSQNFLYRNGYSLAENPSEAVFILNVNRENDLDFIKNGLQYHFNSFEELSENIRK